MGTVGWQEMTFIFFLALVLFGPKELPKIGRTIGKALAEFRRASSDLKATFDRELNNLERETQHDNEAGKSISGPSDYKYNYGYDSYYDAASTPAPKDVTCSPGIESGMLWRTNLSVPPKHQCVPRWRAYETPSARSVLAAM